MKKGPNTIKLSKKPTILLFIIILLICIAVFVKTIFVKDTYINVELLVGGGEWWWDTSHPPYWLGDPIVEGAAEYTIQGKKQSTLLLAPNNIQLYANVIGIQGISPERKHKKRTVSLKWYNVYPWQADAISVGDKMISSEKDVWATILSKDVTNAEKIILNEDTQSLQGNVVIETTNPLKRDVVIKAEIKTTLATNSEVFAYYLPVKIGDMIIINLPKIIITPLIIDIQ